MIGATPAAIPDARRVWQGHMEGPAMKAMTAIEFPALPKQHEGLCLLQMPRPIHDGMEHDNVTQVAAAMALWR